MSTFDRDAAREVFYRLPLSEKQIEEVLDALAACVRPAPPQTIDRDALPPLTDRERAALIDVANWGIGELLDTVRSIEADSVATEDELDIAIDYGVRADVGQRALDRFVAMLRPVEGITLTREEVALAARALRLVSVQDDDRSQVSWALAERLEAAS